MIVDSLARVQQYVGVHPYFEGAMALAMTLFEKDVPAGKYEGENGVYVSVQEYETKILEDIKAENHHAYIDVQLITCGTELIIVADAADCCLTDPYTSDAEFFALPAAEKQQLLTLTKGAFAVFFPGDAHAPGLAFADTPEKVKKLVVKIPVPE